MMYRYRIITYVKRNGVAIATLYSNQCQQLSVQHEFLSIYVSLESTLSSFYFVFLLSNSVSTFLLSISSTHSYTRLTTHWTTLAVAHSTFGSSQVTNNYSPSWMNIHRWGCSVAHISFTWRGCNSFWLKNSYRIRMPKDVSWKSHYYLKINHES